MRNVVAMAGPKLEDAESNAAIRRACTVEAEAEFQLDEILMPDCSFKKKIKKLTAVSDCERLLWLYTLFSSSPDTVFAIYKF